MLVKIYSAAPVGIDAVKVTIEVHSKPGFDFMLVGLPDVSVKESHERILAALTINSMEALHRSYTINMAPADIKKEGAAFDLPLAIGMLAGGEKLKTKMLADYMIMGELSLDGSLQPIRGALPIALCARREGFKGLILPAANAEEAAVVEGLEVYGLDSLLDVVHFLNGEPKDELNPEDKFGPTHVNKSMWIERGLNIKYMKFLLPHEKQLTESEKEIELDDYRSYHRDKRSSLDTAK